MKRTEEGIKNMVEEAFEVASEEDRDFEVELNDLQDRGYLTDAVGLEMKVGDQTFIITIQEK